MSAQLQGKMQGTVVQMAMRQLVKPSGARASILSKPPTATKAFPGAARNGRVQARRQRSIVMAASSAPPREIETVEEPISETTSRMKITIPAELCQKVYNDTLERYRKTTKVDGYRKGKVPDHFLIKHLGGQTRFNNSVLSDLLEIGVAAALEPQAHRLIDESEAIEQDAETLEKAFNPSNDFTFSVKFDTMPALKWSTPYKQLQINVKAVSNEAKDAETLAARMKTLQKESGTLKVVADRGIQKGDVVILNFDAELVENGEAIPGAKREKMQLDTDSADTEFLPGVVDALLGMKINEDRVTTISFPTTENFPQYLRGKDAKVTIKTWEVFEWDLPTADDAWAATVLTGASLADVKARLEENLKTENEEAMRQRIADAMTEAVAAAVDVAVPDSLLQETGRNEYSRELSEMMQKGALSLEQAQQLATPQFVANYIKNKKADLEELQRATMGYANILDTEGLRVSEQEIEEEMARAIESVRSMGSNDIDEASLREKVVNSLENQAVMDWLIDNCTINVGPYVEGA